MRGLIYFTTFNLFASNSCHCPNLHDSLKMIACSRYAGLRGPFRTGLMFLFHLAWKSRVRLPVLIAIGFMVLDIRLQLEINIDLGRAGRQGVPLLGQGNAQPGVIDLDNTDSEETFTGEEIDSESYTTDSYSLHSGSVSSFDSDEEENNEANENQNLSNENPQ